MTELGLTRRPGEMEDLDLAPDDFTHSSRVKAGIARAKARGRKWGRPTITEKKMDPDLSVKVSEMRAQGFPWSEVAIHLDVSESTARRLLRKLQVDREGLDEYRVKRPFQKELYLTSAKKTVPMRRQIVGFPSSPLTPMT